MAKIRSFSLATKGVTRTGADTMQGRLIGGIRVYGIPELQAKLRMVDQVIYRDLGLIMYRNAQFIKTRSVARAPINKRQSPTRGALKRSHYVEKKAPYTYNIVADTSEETGRDYAGYQEHGFHDRGGNWHPGRKFMVEALREGRQEAQTALGRLARKIELL